MNTNSMTLDQQHAMESNISVIIPCYNAKSFILEAVRSALEQTLSPDSVIVVDDGSDDNSGKIVEAAFRDDPRVSVLYHPGNSRCGVLASRRLGLGSATTEWVALLDADDAFASEKLAYQANLRGRYPHAIMIHTPTEIIYEPGMESTPWKNDFRLGDVEREYQLTEEPSWMDSNVICNSTVLARRRPLLTVLDRISSQQVFQYEDWLAWSLLGFEGRFVYGPRPMTRYRLHAASATAAILQNKLKHFYSYMEFLLQLLTLIPDDVRHRFAPPITRRIRHTVKKLLRAYAPDSIPTEKSDKLAETLFESCRDHVPPAVGAT